MRFSATGRSFGLLLVAAMMTVLFAGPAAADRRDRSQAGNGRNSYPAETRWHGGHSQQSRGGHSYGGNRYHDNSGAIAGGALLGLGLGAMLGGALLAPPPAVYAPTPRYYYYNGGQQPYYAYPYVPPQTMYYGN
jgi:hypothetical protein